MKETTLADSIYSGLGREYRVRRNGKAGGTVTLPREWLKKKGIIPGSCKVRIDEDPSGRLIIDSKDSVSVSIPGEWLSEIGYRPEYGVELVMSGDGTLQIVAKKAVVS